MPAPRDAWKFQIFYRQDFGTGLRISSKDSLSTDAWHLEEGPEVEQSGWVVIDICGTPCVTGFCTPSDDHCIFDSSRNFDPTRPGGARTASAEPRNHETSAFRHSSQQRKNIEMRQLLHVPCNSRDHRTVHVIGHCGQKNMRCTINFTNIQLHRCLGRLSVPEKIV